jgi:hypothetical protein
MLHGRTHRRRRPPRAEDADQRTRLPQLGVRHADELLRRRVGVQVRRQYAPCAVVVFRVWGPLWSECGTYRTVTVGFWPGISGKSPWNISSYFLFTRKR